jgi:peptidoglycan/LPS O-acetylase OafA/YrhL
MPAPERARRRPRIGALDGMRLVAALMVVAYHYLAESGGWQAPGSQTFPHTYLLARYGWLGVELFFLISGFVICMSAWGRPLGDFFVSRVVRLYPAYWLSVVLVTMVVRLWPTTVNQRGPITVLVNLTMLQEPFGHTDVDGVYWTLWAEMRFYLLFAIVIWRGVTYRRALMFCALWVIGCVIAPMTGSNVVQQLVMPQYAPFFIGGVALYLVYRFGPSLLLAGVVGVSYVMAIDQTTGLIDHAGQNLRDVLPMWPGLLLVTLFYAAVGAVALGWTTRVNWRWLGVAGGLTYPLYLLHEYIGWTVVEEFRDDLQPAVIVAILVSGMLVIAWLVNRWVERPTARLLRRGLQRGLADMRTSGP